MLDSLEIYLTRLREDEKDLQHLGARCPAIQFRIPNPTLVEVRYQVAGLHRLPSGEIVVAHEHFAQFFRSPEYPVLTGPLARLTTPGVQHWHPNVDPMTGLICYGVLEPDRWSPSLGLDDIVLMIARMLRLEIFNLTSVIDTAAEAAAYVRGLSERGQVPLDKTPLGIDKEAQP
jgi:ubiquitin-protein ligase